MKETIHRPESSSAFGAQLRVSPRVGVQFTHLTQPVSDVNTLGRARPVSTGRNSGGVYGSNDSSGVAPFMAGNPEPCRYGPCTCIVKIYEKPILGEMKALDGVREQRLCGIRDGGSRASICLPLGTGTRPDGEPLGSDLTKPEANQSSHRITRRQ